MEILKKYIIKVFGIFTFIFGCGFSIGVIVKLGLEQKKDLDEGTQRKIIDFGSNLANEMAKNLGYSLSMVVSSYMFSVLVIKDYFTWANPLIVIGIFFVSGLMASALNFKIEAIKEVLENKDTK